jgi:hypothetical protein
VPKPKMKQFDQVKTLDQIRQQCEDCGLIFDDLGHRYDASDYVTIRTPGCKAVVVWSTWNGVFAGATDRGIRFHSSSTDHENEPWFQALLNFFYTEKTNG